MPPLLYRLRRLEREAGDAGADLHPQRQEGGRRGRSILDRVAAYPFEIDLLLAGRGFYNKRVICRARELVTTVIPVKERRERMKDGFAMHCSYMATYRMYNRRERELRFPPAISVSYQNGDRDKHEQQRRHRIQSSGLRS